MTLLSSIFSGETYLGVDIGTTSIKVAEIERLKRGPAILKNYGVLETRSYLDRFNEVLQTSSLKLVGAETATYLKLLIEKAGVRTKKVIASLPAFSAFTTLIELPMMPDSDLVKIVRFQARQYIPLTLSAVTIDWIKVGERMDEGGIKKVQVLLISILNEQIDKYKKIFEAAGLKLMAMELEGISLARVLTAGIKEPVLIMDIGARSSSFFIAQDGFLKFVGQTDFAGGSLTQVLASGLSVSPRKAEELKKEGGLLSGRVAEELSTIMKPLLDVIINEAKRVKNSYEESYKEPVKRVILTGGGSRLLGMEKYIGSQLGLLMEKGNPFEKVSYPPRIESSVDDLKPVLATAIGLALKEV